MSVQTVKLPYKPRPYFTKFHARTQRFSVLVFHRRAGKTKAVVNDMIVRGMRTRKTDWIGVYVAPYYGQAKKIAWKYLKNDTACIPGVKVNESETSIRFPNGSMIYITGADNDKALRGLYFDYVILDEIGDIPRKIWTEVIRATVAERKGSVVFMGTPKGKNFFWELVRKAQNSDGKWYYQKEDVETTAPYRPIDPAELADIKEDLDESEWNQEFMCSFDAALRGSYYGKQMAELRRRGQLTKVNWDSSEKVNAALDVGRADATAIWFWQIINGRFCIFDYFESTGLDAEETCDILELRPYAYETIWLPHDAFHKTWSSKKSGFDTFLAHDLPVRKVPNPDAGNRIYHGVDAVRKVLRTYPIDMDAERCARGIECLFNYSRKYDVEKQIFSDTPMHDQWSHGADSFRYFAQAINPADVQRSVERTQQRALRATDVNNSRPTGRDLITNRVTFGELLKAHDDKIADMRRFSNKLRS